MIYSRVNFQDTYNSLQKDVHKANKDIAFHNVKTALKIYAHYLSIIATFTYIIPIMKGSLIAFTFGMPGVLVLTPLIFKVVFQKMSEASDAISDNAHLIKHFKSNKVIKKAIEIKEGRHQPVLFVPYTHNFLKMNTFEEAKQKYENEKAKYWLSSIRFA